MRQRQVQLTKGSCPNSAAETNYTFTRETDNTTWCLSNLSETPIFTHWSQDGSRMAYAFRDKTNPSRQLSPRWGSIYVDNLNWYLINSDGSGHRRFSIPEPHTFHFSPDGQYADYSTYNDYGQTKSKIIKIEDGSLICEYSNGNLWYYEGIPPCNDILLKNGELWDIESKENRAACQYWVDMYGSFPRERASECEKLFEDAEHAENHSTQSEKREGEGD